MNDHARVLFFATLREKTGVREAAIEFPQASIVADIKKIILEKYPAIEPMMDTIIVAMNHEFAFDEETVPNDAEIAFFPPVSGGDNNQEKYPTKIAIVDDGIDINEIVAEITSKSTGAMCIFIGIVRGETQRGRAHQTESLLYDAYQEMAETKLYQICAEIRTRWNDIQGIMIVQRIGQLIPGTISVVIACSAFHRDCGIFEAARYGIDRLKEIVPIWKKERGSHGEEWIEGEYFPERGD